MSAISPRWSHATLKSCYDTALDQATIDLGLAEADHEYWQPSTNLAQARRLAFDGLRLAGWSLEYTVRGAGHLLQYDGCCHAYKGQRHETVFWGGPGHADTEATALTRLACWCATGEEG